MFLLCHGGSQQLQTALAAAQALLYPSRDTSATREGCVAVGMSNPVLEMLDVWHRGLSSLSKPASVHHLPIIPSLKICLSPFPSHSNKVHVLQNEPQNPLASLQPLAGFGRTERHPHADGNTLPGLESTDGVDLCDVHDGSQGFQGSTASLPHLPRQKDPSEPGHRHTSATVPALNSPSPSQVGKSQSQEQLRMYLVSGTTATSPAALPRPPASHCQRAGFDRILVSNSPLWEW